jgi:hypothetical protein
MQLLLMLPDGAEERRDHRRRQSPQHRGVRALALQVTAGSQRGLLLGYGRLREPSIPAAVAALSKFVLETNA